MNKYIRTENRKYHFIYRTTCIVTSKWYIGMHSTDNLEDGYLGSGSILSKSVKKYGKEKHQIEILEHFSDRQTLSDREEEILTTELRTDPMCMNIRSGGTGNYPGRPTSEETRAKLSKASKGYVRTEEWYEKAVATRRANDSYKHTEETKKVMSEKGKGRTLSEEARQKISEKNTGQKRTEETRTNISAARKGVKNKVPTAPFSDERREDIRQSRIGMKHSEEAKANMRKPKDMSKNMRACTVDGLKIYPSIKQLVAELGSGKSGSRSPNFRFIRKR